MRCRNEKPYPSYIDCQDTQGRLQSESQLHPLALHSTLSSCSFHFGTISNIWPFSSFPLSFFLRTQIIVLMSVSACVRRSRGSPRGCLRARITAGKGISPGFPVSSGAGSGFGGGWDLGVFSKLDSWGFLREKPDSHSWMGGNWATGVRGDLICFTAVSCGHLFRERRAAAGERQPRLERKAARLLALVDEKEATSGQKRDALKQEGKDRLPVDWLLWTAGTQPRGRGRAEILAARSFNFGEGTLRSTARASCSQAVSKKRLPWWPRWQRICL